MRRTNNKDDKEIELTTDASIELNSLEINKLAQVHYNLHLLNFKKAFSSLPNQNCFQTFYADKTKTYKNICLQVDDESELKLGDIHLIKSVKVVLSKDVKIYFVGKKAFEVIGHRKIPQSNEEASQGNGRENVEIRNPLPKPQINNLPFNPSHYLLSHLTTFSQEIKVFVKISKKSELKEYIKKNNGQPGKLFSFNMVDIEGYEMTGTAFGGAAQKLSSLLVENNHYLIKGGFVTLNDKRFSTARSDYRITFDEKTQIEEINHDVQFSKTQLHLVKIEDLPKLSLNLCVDCYVYVIEAGEKRSITSKKGDELEMRKVNVGDTSGYKCQLTLWRNLTNLDIKDKQILLLQYVRVSEFNGRNLNSIDETVITINPPNGEAKKLHEMASNFSEWKTLENSNLIDFNFPTEVTYLQEILDKVSQHLDKGPLYKMKVTICLFHHSQRNYYPGCPETHCRKKLSNDHDGFRCPGCDKSIEKPIYYYTLNFMVKDASIVTYVDVFGETATKLLGIPSEEYKDLIENNDSTKLNEITNKIGFQTKIMYGRGKITAYNGVEKSRISVYRIEDLNSALEAKATLNLLKSYHMK